MKQARDISSKSSVIVVGPPPSMVGGMASVVEQILSMDLGTHYRADAFPTTISTDRSESLCGRVLRHAGHLRSLAGVIRRLRSPIVHLHTCSGFSFHRSTADLFLARRLGCRTILHIHGAAFDKFYAGAGRVQRRLIARSLSRTDCVIALSQQWRRELLKMAPRARIAVVENAVACPGDLPPRVNQGPCRFLLLAKMDLWKGIDDLLDATARLRATGYEFELVLAGPDGTAGDADTLANKINSRGLGAAVRYAGCVRGEEKSELLRWADVYVQPSHHEGMPIALLEGLAYGLAIIATRVGAVPEVITDRHEGLLVPSHSPARLAEAMCALATDRPRRNAMASAARRLASTRFSIDRFRDDLISLYDDVSGRALQRAATRSLGPGRDEPHNAHPTFPLPSPKVTSPP